MVVEQGACLAGGMLWCWNTLKYVSIAETEGMMMAPKLRMECSSSKGIRFTRLDGCGREEYTTVVYAAHRPHIWECWFGLAWMRYSCILG
jgi:hypothetical protein